MAEYEWKQTAPGRYERDMDDVEIHYNLISNSTVPLGRQMWATTASLKFELQTEDFVAEVRRAWTKLRFQHPSIAMTMEKEKEKKVYEIISDQAALDQWVAKTFVVVENHTSKTLHPELSSKMFEQSTIFVLPTSQEIMLRVTHENADAIGIIATLACIAKNMASTSECEPLFDGSEVSKLPLPLAKGFHIPVGSEEGKAFAAGALEEMFSHLPGLGLPMKNADQLPQNALRYDYAFSKEETTRIMQACKSKNLTPIHMLQTAAMMATYQLTNDPSRKWATMAIFDLRRYCNEPVRSEPLGINIIGWPVVYEPPYDSFQDLSQRVKSFYTSLPKDPRLFEGLRPHWHIMKQALQPGAPPPPPASEPIISSIGIVDPLLGSVYEGDRNVFVKDFWIATNVVTAHPAIHLWTWQGVMRFSIAYNEAYHAEADIVRFLERFLKILRVEALDT